MMRFDLLDHGYVELISTEGNDQFLAETARMSTKSTATASDNENLVRRLIRDEHTSPIEFGGMVLEIKCPILVARQWIRHRAGVFNEFSGRYSEFPKEYYVPALERIQAQSTFNKQGSAEQLPKKQCFAIKKMLVDQAESQYASYEDMLKMGLTRELARMVLGTNYYTVYRWRVNLHNLFHFLKLREDQHAQFEIREYANAIHNICESEFPVATRAFEDHIQNKVTISPAFARIINEYLKDGDYVADTSESREFIRRYA